MSTVLEQQSSTAAAAPPARPRLNAGANGTLMSPQEFDAIDDWDEDYRYELIHGVVIVSPIPLEDEVDPNEQLGHWLRTYLEQHPDGTCIDLTLPERYIHIPDGSRRRADRVIWVGLGRRPRPKQDVPTIAVEFVSESKRDWRRDYIDKRREYLAAGVREYWVIDRFDRKMTIFTASAEQTVPEDGIYKTDLLPGFELPLAKLLGIADRWVD